MEPKLNAESNANTSKTAIDKKDDMISRFFIDDIVYKLNANEVQFGTIIQTYEVNAYDLDDKPLASTVRKGTVLVNWLADPRKPEIVDETCLHLLERALSCGDAVRRINPTTNRVDGQHGYCRDVSTVATVRVYGTEQVIENIPIARLQAIEMYPLGVAASYDSWVGSIRGTQTHLTVSVYSLSVGRNVPLGRFTVRHNEKCCMCMNGTRYYTHEFADEIERDIHFERQACVMRPCELYGVKWTHIKNARLKRSRIPHKFVVEHVNEDVVMVHWQCTPVVHSASETAVDAPPSDMKGEKVRQLQLAKVFDQFGQHDMAYLTIQDDHAIPGRDWMRQNIALYGGSSTPANDLPDWETESDSGSDDSDDTSNTPHVIQTRNVPKKIASKNTTKTLRYKINNPRVRVPSKSKKTYVVDKVKLCRGQTITVCVLLTKTVATIVWQDGGIESNVPSRELLPIHYLDDRDFFPGDFVVRNDEPQTVHNYGVIERMDCEQRTALVNWFHLQTIDAICDISNNNKPARDKSINTCVNVSDANTLALISIGTEEVSVYAIKDHPDFNYRPGTVVIPMRVHTQCETETCWLGQVIDIFPSGQIRVQWVNQTQTMCWPQDLYRVGDYSDFSDLWSDDDDDDDFNEINDFTDDDDDESNASSWSTASEISDDGDATRRAIYLHERLVKSVTAMTEKLEKILDIFRTHTLTLSRSGVLGKLKYAYMRCNYLDKLLGTDFFQLDCFDELVAQWRAVTDAAGITCKTPVCEKFNSYRTRVYSNAAEDANDEKPDKAKESEARKLIQHQFDELQQILQHDVKPIKRNSLQHDQHARETPLKTPATIDGMFRSTEAHDAIMEFFYTHKLTVTDIQTERDTFTLTLCKRAVACECQCWKSRDNTHAARQFDGTCWLCECDAVRIDAPNVDANRVVALLRAIQTFHTRHGVVCGNIDGFPSGHVNVTGTVVEFTIDQICIVLYKCNCQSLDANKTDVEARSASETRDELTKAKKLELTLPVTSILQDRLETPLDEQTAQSDETNVKLLAIAESICALFKQQLIAAQNELEKRTSQLKQNDLDVVKAPLAIDDDDLMNNASDDPPPVRSPAIVTNASNVGVFKMLENAPKCHQFEKQTFVAARANDWFRNVYRETDLLTRSLPPGIWVYGFEDRFDLMSAMIRGPRDTPFEDGLFLFDVQLGQNYPNEPPAFHYVSYCSDRLNPNLYESGKVCVSLLGTWEGRDSEVWEPHKSSVLQVLISIQGLILNAAPYFNEANYEIQKQSVLGDENNRKYNELATLKMIESMIKLIKTPHPTFKNDIVEHFRSRGPRLVKRLESMLMLYTDHSTGGTLESHSQRTIGDKSNSSDQSDSSDEPILPTFAILPLSKGFYLSLKHLLPQFRAALGDVCRGSVDVEGYC